MIEINEPPSQEASSFNFLSLPLEIIVKILESYLSPHDLSKIRATCIYLRNLIDGNKNTLEQILSSRLAHFLSKKISIIDVDIYKSFNSVAQLPAFSSLLTVSFFYKMAAELHQKAITNHQGNEGLKKTLYYLSHEKNYLFKFIQETDLNSELTKAQISNRNTDDHPVLNKTSYVLCFYSKSAHEWIANHVTANGIEQETEARLIEKLNDINPLQAETYNNNEIFLSKLNYILQERDFQKKQKIY